MKRDELHEIFVFVYQGNTNSMVFMLRSNYCTSCLFTFNSKMGRTYFSVWTHAINLSMFTYLLSYYSLYFRTSCCRELPHAISFCKHVCCFYFYIQTLYRNMNTKSQGCLDDTETCWPELIMLSSYYFSCILLRMTKMQITDLPVIYR